MNNSFAYLFRRYCLEKMRLKHIVIYSLTYILFTAYAQAQNDNSAFCISHTINPADSDKLYLSIENGNYFKNMYYFNNFEAGYKEIGYFIQPTLTYFPTDRTKIMAGIYLLKYSGLDNFTNEQPVLSFQYHICDGIDMVLGTLYGTSNHKLIEPIFQFDRYMNNHVENGLQFLFDTKRIQSDIWLNWEKFIFDLSPIQERFTVGSSNTFCITDPQSLFQLKIPVQFLFAHRGGMHTVQEAPVQTLFNFVSGLDVSYNFNGSLFHTLAFRGYIAHYADLSNQKLEPFTKGDGLYPNLILEGKHFDVMVGYWDANKFIAPRGDFLFQSVSQKDSTFTESKRNLLNFKIDYHFVIKNGLELGTRFESYYDTKHLNFDYVYGVYITFNPSFFLMKVH